MVSTRVVKTLRTSEEFSSPKPISAPQLLPIQLICWVFIFSKKSTLSKSSINLSAYFVIFSIHCFKRLCSVLAPHLSHDPSTTSSLARPILQLGHQLMGTSA